MFKVPVAKPDPPQTPRSRTMDRNASQVRPRQVAAPFGVRAKSVQRRDQSVGRPFRAPVHIPRREDHSIDPASAYNHPDANIHDLIVEDGYRPSYEGVDWDLVRRKFLEEAREFPYPPNALPERRRSNRLDGINSADDCLGCYTTDEHYLGDCVINPLAQDRINLWDARSACLLCRAPHGLGEECSTRAKYIECENEECKRLVGGRRHSDDFCILAPKNIARMEYLGRRS